MIDSKACRAAALALLAYAAFDLLLPLIPVPIRHMRGFAVLALAVVPTALFMLLQLWLSHSLVRLKTRAIASIGLLIGSLILWFLTLWLVHPHHHIGLYALRQMLLGLFITTACTFFGVLLSRIVREPNILAPVALIAMPIDYLGAMTNIGFTQNVVHAHPSIVRAVSVPVPAVAGLPIFPFIGPGDALFMAFFFAVVLRLGMNDRGTFWWMYGLLTPSLIAVIVLPDFAIAALVPMGLAVLIANFKFFRLKRAEAFAVLYAAIFVIALVVGFYTYSHAHFFHHIGN